eukprot:GHRQ01031780.1.p2 GENE.GHRQ01031780.1~~GHRQ01031780.1.p2  ORF type:complete len:130 (+),score=38.70 GHRQ01031780.1:1077-1466(+)
MGIVWQVWQQTRTCCDLLLAEQPTAAAAGLSPCAVLATPTFCLRTHFCVQPVVHPQSVCFNVAFFKPVPSARCWLHALSGRHNPEIAADLFPEWPVEQRVAFYEEKEQRFRDMSGGQSATDVQLMGISN